MDTRGSDQAALMGRFGLGFHCSHVKYEFLLHFKLLFSFFNNIMVKAFSHFHITWKDALLLHVLI